MQDDRVIQEQRERGEGLGWCLLPASQKEEHRVSCPLSGLARLEAAGGWLN